MASLHLSSHDKYLFHEGNYFRGYESFGAHLTNFEGVDGAVFNLWAPNAKQVKVIGEFNDWYGKAHCMERAEDSGIWTLFIPGVRQWDMYKYEITTIEGQILHKSDPYAFYSEFRPGTASKVVTLEGYDWGDGEWIEKRKERNIYESPVNIYEVHLGSWKRKWDGSYFTYRELADELVDYVSDMGYTHIELMPVTEYPFDGSWGYQSTGYFSVTSRYGSPQDFMYFVDKCHQKGIGVILDWVPGHFCKDAHGLACFDGTPLYEYEDPMRRENKGWGTAHFDLGKPEVISFLISGALFWMDIYHIDGFRVDAVASMLYLDYDKKPGEWRPNRYGGRENLESVAFLRKLNEVVFRYFPGSLVIAEESTAWPMVTGAAHEGGLGFNYKWNMGWMNDMLRYMEMDSVYRKWHHNLITFSFVYTYSENYVLPLSHDEVVHGKKSLIDKMPGDYWQKFANLRAFYGYMMAHPGKKLLFMGGELGQFLEWRYDYGLDWILLQYELHRKLQYFVKTLNHFYKEELSLSELDHQGAGFRWIDPHNYNQSVITFMRKSRRKEDFVLFVCNFTPTFHGRYRIGVPHLGSYREVLNSDSEEFGGSGHTNPGLIEAEKIKWHSELYSIEIKVPALSAVFIKPEYLAEPSAEQITSIEKQEAPKAALIEDKLKESEDLPNSKKDDDILKEDTLCERKNGLQ